MISMPDGDIMTSLVMDEKEFTTLLEFLKDFVPTIEPFKKHRMVPLIFRGTKTAPIFEKYEIDSLYCSFVIRGYAKEFLKQHQDKTVPVLVTREEAEKRFADSFEELPVGVKTEINTTIDDILQTLEMQTPEQIFMRFINKFGKEAPRKIRFDLVDSMLYSARVTLSSYRLAFNEKTEVITEYRKYLIRLFTGSYLAIIETAKSEQN